jgi:urease accessory protein
MIRTLPLALTILLIPVMAMAHPGHDDTSSFIAGLSHPVFGPDHLLAMIAVGLWAALTGGRALWAYPAAFVVAMLAGGLVGSGAATIPVVEPMILASVMVIGAAAALTLRVTLWAALPALALFGLAHGYAHGLEGPGGAEYALGFVIATGALHGAGIALARLGLFTGRLLGAGVAVAGVVLAVAA